MTKLSWEESRHFYTCASPASGRVHAALVVAFSPTTRWPAASIEDGRVDHTMRWTNVAMNVLMLHEVPPASPHQPPVVVDRRRGRRLPDVPPAGAGPRAVPHRDVRVRHGRDRPGGRCVDLRAALPPADLFMAVYGSPWMRIVFGFVAGAFLNVGWRALRPAGTDADGTSPPSRRSWSSSRRSSSSPGPGPLVIPVAAYPFLGLLVPACAGATGVVGRLLSSGPVEWSGRLSYSVYMTHYLVVIALQTTVHPHRRRRVRSARAPAAHRRCPAGRSR